jgi:predicted outer membrane repeat protein
MTRSKIISLFILLFCAFFSLFCYADVDFINQSDVDNNSRWLQITNSNPGVFFDNFDISSGKQLNNDSIIRSDSQSVKRTLNASSDNKFFYFDNSQSYVTINNITLQKGKHMPSSDNDGGGAIHTNSPDFNLYGNIFFEQNTSSACGGAVYAGGNIWISNPMDNIIFLSNTAAYNGGALCVVGSATFNGGAYLINNVALHSSGQARDGGAIYSGGSVVFKSASASIELSSNIASGNGGAIFALNNVEFNSNVTISYNKSNDNGGAICSSNGYVSFKSYVTATGNETTSSKGGAVFSKGIMITDGASFSNNKSSQEGGAIYVYDSTNSYIGAITKDVVFSGNNMAIKNETIRNDIYMGGNSSLGFFNILNLDARELQNITLNGGIRCSGDSDVVNKTGSGALNLNGDFILPAFNVLDGSLSFGDGSSFKGGKVSFSSNATINLGRKKDYIIEISTFNSNALFYYDLDLQSSDVDKFFITNTADLNGTKVKVSFIGINSTTATYNIVSSSENAQGDMLIDNTNVDGNIMTRVNSYIIYDTGNPASWKSVNLNIYVNELSKIESLADNERQVALSLDGDYGKAKSDLFFIIDSIDRMGNIQDRKNALLNLSGYIYANAIIVPAINTYKNNVLLRLDRSYFPNSDSFYKRNVWVQGCNSKNNFKGTLDSPGDFNILNNDVQVGFDTLREDTRIFGIALGYREVKSDQNGDKVDIKGYNVGGYWSKFFENNFEIRTFIAGARQDYFSSRSIDYLNRNTTADFRGYSLSSSGDIAYSYYMGNNFCLKPFVCMDYAYVTRNEFSESGAQDASLLVFESSYNRLCSSLGIKVSNGIDNRLKWYILLQTDILLHGEIGEFRAILKNGTQNMSIKGIELDMVSNTVGVGILCDISKDFSVYLNLNDQFSKHQDGYYSNVGLNYKFSTQPIDFYQYAS